MIIKEVIRVEKVFNKEILRKLLLVISYKD